uniref:Uncharacterized protein n=1 Tax=Panagrolaimus sp. ES5 TaxID=591445 RepID=A0AC34FTK9_9BILA
MNDDTKFNIIEIKDLEDEINLSWKYYDSYFSKLYQEYNLIVQGKAMLKKINEQHQVLNQNDNKVTMHQINIEIRKFENLFDKESRFLNGILWTEYVRAEKIDKILEKLAPAIAALRSTKKSKQ